jgi:hypothetical protein
MVTTTEGTAHAMKATEKFINVTIECLSNLSANEAQ